jgi:paraquat-inducible protein B
VSASAIYGLGTIARNFHIVDPGRGKSTATSSGWGRHRHDRASGRHFILESERKGSLEVGAPIYYRQIRAGAVVAYHLSEDGTKIVSKVFVNAPYHQFVRNNRGLECQLVDVKWMPPASDIHRSVVPSSLGIAFDTFKTTPTRRASPVQFSISFQP